LRAVWHRDGSLVTSTSRQLADGSWWTVHRWLPPGAEL
jgi:hypothetical protein